MSDARIHNGTYSHFFRDDPYQLLTLQLAESQNWRCCYCGVLMNRFRRVATRCTIEHVIPRTAGGRLQWETCVSACYKCNQEGGKRIYQEGLLSLNFELCAICGGIVRQTRARIVRCDSCQINWAVGSANNVKFFMGFSLLRRVAGELLVSNSHLSKIDDILASDYVRTRSLRNLAPALAELSRESVAEAKRRYSDLVEAYEWMIADLKRRYVPRNGEAPERGPSRTAENVLAQAIPSSSGQRAASVKPIVPSPRHLASARLPTRGNSTPRRFTGQRER